MSDLISEAEACSHIAHDGKTLSFMSQPDRAFVVWLTAKSTRVPTILKQKCMQKAKAQQLDREETQVGCDLGLSVGQGRKGHSDRRHDGRIYIYRKWFETLLKSDMPLRDRLIVEYSLLEALRTGEISSLRVSYCDLASGLIHVLDSKKHSFRLVPYRAIVAKHTATYIQMHHLKLDDILLQSRKKHQRKPDSKCRGVGLTEASIERIMGQHCLACGIPELNPRDGRAYFATVWHFVKHKSMYHLKAILGHEDIQSTEHYLDKIVDVQDMINEFHEGDAWFGRGKCVLFEHCDLATEGCHCRMFQPQTIKEVQE